MTAQEEQSRVPIQEQDAIWIRYPLAPIYRTMYEGKRNRRSTTRRGKKKKQRSIKKKLA